jgi:hypothetical protein
MPHLSEENLLGVAALVVGIIGIFVGIIPFYVTQILGLVLGVMALILGIVARKQAVEEGNATGVATGGIVTGIAAVVISILVFSACQLCLNRVVTPMSEGWNKALRQIENDPQLREKLRRWNEEVREVQRRGQGLSQPSPKFTPEQPPTGIKAAPESGPRPATNEPPVDPSRPTAKPAPERGARSAD